MIITMPIGSILMQAVAYTIVVLFSLILVTQEPLINYPNQIEEDSSLPNIAVVYKYELNLLDEIYNEGPEYERDVLLAWRERSEDIDALITDGWRNIHELDKLHVLSHDQAIKDKNKILQIGQAYRRILETMEERQKLYGTEWSLVEWRSAVFQARYYALQQIKHHEGQL